MKWYRIRALLLNYYYFTRNSMDRIFDVVYWPILDVFIWGFMTYYISGISDLNLLSVIFGGIVLWVFIWRASQDIVVYLLEQYWSRSIYYLFSSPVKNSELIISLCLLGLIRGLLGFVILSTLGAVLYGFNVFMFNPLHLILFATLLVMFGWGIGLFISSLVFMFGSRVQVLAWSTIWIVQPFSCVFYPLSALPEWAQLIARVLPTTHIFEGMREVIRGGSVNGGSIVYAASFIVLFIILGTIVVSGAILFAKKRGTFAKPE